LGVGAISFYTLYFGNFKNHTHYITIVTRETQTNIKNGLKANTPHKLIEKLFSCKNNWLSDPQFEKSILLTWLK
jgi:hypothetical protein